MLLHNLLEGLINIKDLPNPNIENVTAKISRISHASLFILFQGVTHDKRDMINEIISKKPTVIISEIDIAETDEIIIIKADNARMLYSLLSYKISGLSSYSYSLYAITGTNGKTTTATMLHAIFSNNKEKCALIGTGKILMGNTDITPQNYSMTTPDPEDLYSIIKTMCKNGCNKIIMEASSHAISLFKLYPLKFKASVFTNFSPEHLDYHKTTEDYFGAKLKLFYQSESAIFNIDDLSVKKAFEILKDDTRCYSVGIKSEADTYASKINNFSFKGIEYTCSDSEAGKFRIELSLIGTYNISNSLLAIKCALLENVKPSVIQDAIKGLNTIPGRFEKIVDNPLVIIDYAHTIDAYEKILNFTKQSVKQGQKIFLVFGCGGDRDRSKRPAIASIAEKNADVIIVTSDNSRSESTEQIFADIIKGFSNANSFMLIENRTKAIRYAINTADESDVILIVGKGHERYNIDKKGYHKYDEKAIILKAVNDRKKRSDESST